MYVTLYLPMHSGYIEKNKKSVQKTAMLISTWNLDCYFIRNNLYYLICA